MGRSPKKKDFKEKTNEKDDLEFETLSFEQEIPLEKLKEHFPALYQEINKEVMKIKIDEQSVGTNGFKTQNDSTFDPFTNYEPDIFDYLARAKTEAEGHEIVDFLENQKKITSQIASEIRKKIKKDGIRSFGPLRGPNYYFQKAGEISTKNVIKKRYFLSRDLEESD